MLPPLDELEKATRTFYDWELRGRGWAAYPSPVELEPAFRPYRRYIPSHSTVDDGQRPGFFGRLLSGSRPAQTVTIESQDKPGEPEPSLATSGPLEEWEIVFPEGESAVPSACEAWLRAIRMARHPVAFELLGQSGSVAIRLALNPADASLVIGQLRAYLPQAVQVKNTQPLASAWNASSEAFALEFGLAREFMLSLRIPPDRPDPLAALVGALAETSADEAALIQVLFEEVRRPWAEHALAALIAPDGSPFFLDAPELTTSAEDKFTHPLYTVTVRIAAHSTDPDEAFERIRSLASTVGIFGSPSTNELIPLATESQQELIGDILRRQTRRSGMLLSLPELASLVRFPGAHFTHPALNRSGVEELPTAVRGSGTPIGLASDGRRAVPVTLSKKARLQHTHVIGASGTGKSTLLERMAAHDISSGNGLALLDPHGDLAETVLSRIPENRIRDVILFDPESSEDTARWNVLSARSEAERRVLSSDLTSVIRRLATSWGDQMNIVLGHAIDALLASPHGGTLMELRRFLVDDAFRNAVVETVDDEYVGSFWKHEFPHLIGKRPQVPILTRLDTFLRSPLIREAVCERDRPIDFRNIMDGGKIFIAKLSQGLIGEENCSLLGSLLLSAFHQAALSRQDLPETDRRPFQLYIDEFHQVATPSLASLFSGVRKYGVGLTVAHQSLYQLHADNPEVERAVLGNAYTRIVFRVAEEDAGKLERGMGRFNSEDFLGLSRGEAIVRVGSGRTAFKLTTELLPSLPEESADAVRDEVRRASADAYGRVSGTAEARAPVLRTAPASDVNRPAKEKSPAVSPQQPGRGGPVHKYLQGLIKEWAKREGYRAEIEKEISGGQRVDVALYSSEFSIACEIAGITTVEQEAHNIGKCLAHGFDEVVAVSLDTAFLRKLEPMLESLLQPEEAKRVQLVTPEELLSVLRSRETQTSADRIAGYTVTVRQKDVGRETEARHRAAAQVLLGSIRRMREAKP